MSDVASLIADMVRAGVDPELIGRAAAALAEREPVRVVDEQAERRRAADRERKRLRNSAESAETTQALSLDKKETPQTPLEKTKPIPPSPPKGGSSPAPFDVFWELYPNKVGKADARKKFVKAVRIAPFEKIMAGLRRYVAKTDDRPWCNPATWLHQERWGDQPAGAQPRGSPRSQQPKGAQHFTAFGDFIDGQAGNSTGEQGDWLDAPGVPFLTIEH